MMDNNITPIDVYPDYKPFRNFIRQFPINESLEIIWHLYQNISSGRPLPSFFTMKTSSGHPVEIKQSIQLWELDLLTREVILNAQPTGRRSLATWTDLAEAVNFIRRLDDKTMAVWLQSHDVMRELPRIMHLQFPWQRPPSIFSLLRYYQIFGGPEMDSIVERETGLTTRQHYGLGFAVAGSFSQRPGMVSSTDYSILGIPKDASTTFFDRLSSDVQTLRKSMLPVQKYTDMWRYTWNSLEATPLIQFDLNHPERLICPMPYYLLKRISDGIFYDIFAARGFQNAYGKAFERYIGKMLSAVCTSPGFKIFEEQTYMVRKNLKHGVDWILEDDTGTVFIECKTKRLRRDAKFGSDGSALNEDLAVLAGAIAQNYKNITEALEGLTTWVPRETPAYSLIITLENWMMFTPSVHEDLDGLVVDLLINASVDPAIMSQIPYLVISVEEFEVGIEAISELGISAFFAENRDCDNRQWRISPLGDSAVRDRAAKASRNRIEQEWKRLQAEIMPSAAQ